MERTQFAKQEVEHVVHLMDKNEEKIEEGEKKKIEDISPIHQAQMQALIAQKSYGDRFANSYTFITSWGHSPLRYLWPITYGEFMLAYHQTKILYDSIGTNWGEMDNDLSDRPYTLIAHFTLRLLSLSSALNSERT